MQADLIKALCEQLDGLVAAATILRSRSQYDDLSDLPEAEHHKLLSRQLAAIQRITDASSAYAGQAQEIMKANVYQGTKIMRLCGVLEAIRADLDAGYLQSITELIHGDVFSDFLDMAQHLLDEKYKDAAAVVAGSTLEAHLRALCQKHGVPTETKVSGSMRPKKADAMNADLAKTGAYSKLDQKSVTAWLDLRNKAAHGKYNEYSADQVGLLIDGVRNFMVRVPA
jgi:hypothetical protein